MERSSTALLVGAVVATVLVLGWILLLPPFSLLRGDARQPAGDGYSVKVEKTVPALPPGLTAATQYYDVFVRQNASGAVSISLPLLDSKSSNRGLSFYSYLSGKWQRIAPADIGQDGASVQGQLQSLPPNLIVLKRLISAVQIMGTLPQGKTLSPDAAKQLTVLNPAGYAPSADGNVGGEPPPAVPGAQYDVIPAVQAQSGPGVQAVNDILASPEKTAAHITALSNLANRPGNNGVELDYTSVAPQQRQAFSDFVSGLALEVHKNHHLLVVELPAPTLSGSGWNTGSYDWPALAKSADYLKLVPSLDESVYRKQMPDLMRFLTGQAGVEARKLVLVTTPYSVEKSDQGTRSLTRLGALSIAAQVQVPNREQAFTGSNVTAVAANLNHDTGGSGLVWDAATATVSFVFKVGDATHVVWIQNEFSEGFKLEYVQIYRLGGVAVDDASNDAAIGNLWPAVAQYAASGAAPLQQPNPQLLVPSWQVDGKPVDTSGKTLLPWQAPTQPGEHTISLIVSDGLVRVIGSTQLAVKVGTPTGVVTGGGGISPVTATPRAAPPTATATVRSPLPAPSATGSR